ncbi:MAG: hypothetical protein LM560_07435 [Desulfurococcaceae archaeon]|nr:hypothetical protein [Desulfurococcaceae archaeon]
MCFTECVGMTAYVICRRCGFKIPLVIKLRSEAPILFYATCPACGFRDLYSYADVVEEGVYRSVCEVCRVRLYSFKLGPVRCPVCGSRYIASTEKWLLIERGTPPPKPTETLGALGLLIGGTTGVSKGKNIAERITNMVTGSIAGLLLGTLVGALLETLTRIEREVIYEHVEPT